jgi:Flp pilus assembly pilin Flp
MTLLTRTFPGPDSAEPGASDDEVPRLTNFHELKPLGNHPCGDFSSRMFGRNPGNRIWAITCGSLIMLEYAKTWLELKLDRRAVTALEYGLIAGVIVATIAVGFSLLANNLSSKFSGIGGSL